MQFNYLKCKFSDFLVQSQSCAPITTVNFETFSSPQKETQYPLTVIPHFFPTLPNHQLLKTINLLSLCLF